MVEKKSPERCKPDRCLILHLAPRAELIEERPGTKQNVAETQAILVLALSRADRHSRCSLSLTNPMKTSVLSLITVLTIAVFLGCQSQKKEETTAASTGTTTTHATAKKTTAKTTGKKTPPPTTPQPTTTPKASKKKAAAEESASPSASPSATP
jgi:hypothetical protein